MYFKLAVTCCHSESFTNSSCLKSKDINFYKISDNFKPQACILNSECWRKHISFKKKNYFSATGHFYLPSNYYYV